jgi:hypothetical protein
LVAIELGVLFFATDVAIRGAVLSSLAVVLTLSLLAHRRCNRLVRALYGTVVALAVACFLLTAAESIFWGGTPLNGKIEGDRYFLGAGGYYREVSPRRYRLALVPNLVVVALWPVAILLPGLLSYAGRDSSKSARTPGHTEI